MAKPRITIAYTKGDDGEPDEILFYVNPEGRDLLVNELSRLDERSDHFHLQDEDWDGEVPLQMKSYVPEEEQVVSAAKVMLRPDHWDAEYFPHVLSNEPK